VNRARGELGLVAFLQGDTNTAIVNLGQAIKVAEATGDVSSVVRWLTLFGHGNVELGRPAQALDFYDRALKIARTIPELQLPVMTFVGKVDALVKLGRVDEADDLVTTALAEARRQQLLGYQAELTHRLALVALERKQTLLEGLLTNAGSPWVRGKILASMDEVVSARIRLEGERNGGDPARLFAVLERARARSLLDLLHARPLSEVREPAEIAKRRASHRCPPTAAPTNYGTGKPSTPAGRDLRCRRAARADDH
jgi:tetratricopeptide (TPR) repeat protein